MMHLPLDQGPGLALGLDAWLGGSHIPLAVAAHPSGVLLALARGAVLTVIPVLPDATIHQQQQSPSGAYPIHHSQHQHTALAWFAQLKPSRSITPAQPNTSPTLHQQPQHNVQPLSQQQQQFTSGLGSNQQQPWQATAAPHSMQHSSQQHIQQQLDDRPGDSATIQQLQQRPRCLQGVAESLIESQVLLSGTADGHLQIHDAAGHLLFRQRFAASPVLDILVRPYCSGLCSSDANEEVCVTFTNALVRINTLDLRSQIRMLQLAQAAGSSAAASVPPLPHIRYELPAAVGPRVSGISIGPLPADLYTVLTSSGSSGLSRVTRTKACIVTVGRGPCLAAFEAEERPNRSTLSALVGMASSLTTGVMGVASKAAGLGPSVVYYGVKSLIKPWSSWYSSSSNSSSTYPAAQAVISYDDLQQLPKPEPLVLSKQLRDDGRVLEGLIPAPVGSLLVAPDNLGRVTLFDGASMAAVRNWKGYRDAQCGWLQPPPSHPAAPLGILLALFAPKRQVLEVWLPRSGQRLASKTVDYPCLLVPVGLPCGGWGNAVAWHAWHKQCGASTTLVMNVQTGEVWDAVDCLVEE